MLIKHRCKSSINLKNSIRMCVKTKDYRIAKCKRFTISLKMEEKQSYIASIKV